MKIARSISSKVGNGGLLRSIRMSSMAGAIKVVCQISVALIVFPIIVRSGGAEALGSWVMLQLIVGYLGLTNFGMGTALTRTIASSADDDNDKLASSVLAVLLAAFAVGVMMFAAILVFMDQIVDAVSAGLTSTIEITAIWMMYCAIIFRLSSSLIGAIVAGLQRTDLVQVSNAIQLISFIVGVFFLVEKLDLINALSAAFLISFILEFAFITIASFRCGVRPLFQFHYSQVGEALQFLKGCVSFLTLDVSLLIREPLLKLAVFWAGGSAAVGYFEIASKVPATIRQGFVQGLSALMPAFANMFRRKDYDNAIAIGKMTLLYIILGAVGALIVYFFNAEFVLHIWIGESNDQLLTFTRICTVWWAISALNVPAWWLGIGVGNVWKSAAVLLFHVVCSLLILLAATSGYCTSLEAIVYWVLSGVAMQILLYFNVSQVTHILRPMYIHPSMAIAAGILVVSSAVMLLVSAITLRLGESMYIQSIAGVALFIVAHLFLVVVINSRYNLGLLRPKVSDA
ncbi:MAG: hypothetical protein P8I38_10750 [Arenicella sp.]|nr:hypothetical protein [Arenicella sp.]